MQPTYNSPATTSNPWQLGPTASRIARWVFGLGFFSVHLGVFLLAGLALLMINLYRSPDDLWVGGPLLRWGFVVVIHGLGAIVTWAITTAVDAAEATRRETVRYQPPRPAPMPVAPPPPIVPRIADSVAPPRPRFQPGVSTPVAPNHAGPGRGRFRGRQHDADAAAPHRPSPPGWIVMGPEDQPRAESPAPAAGSEPSDWSTPGAVPAAPPATPAKFATHDADRPGPDDSRWTWVEAAAEAWLARRPEKPDGTSDASEDTPS